MLPGPPLPPPAQASPIPPCRQVKTDSVFQTHHPRALSQQPRIDDTARQSLKGNSVRRAGVVWSATYSKSLLFFFSSISIHSFNMQEEVRATESFDQRNVTAAGFERKTENANMLNPEYR